MKYSGKIGVLRHYPDSAYNIGELDFIVEDTTIAIPALPFIMLNLKINGDQACRTGWSFVCGSIKFFIPPDEFQKATSAYFQAEHHQPVERFLNPFNYG